MYPQAGASIDANDDGYDDDDGRSVWRVGKADAEEIPEQLCKFASAVCTGCSGFQGATSPNMSQEVEQSHLVPEARKP